ncbi:MAG: adenylyl-sulfate kinase [Pseudohongiellaceae bacterium]
MQDSEEQFDPLRGTPAADSRAPLRFIVQRVLAEANTRLLVTGLIAAGNIRAGDRLIALPGAKPVTIAGITLEGRGQQTASAGTSPSLSLEEFANIAPGDILSGPDERPQVSDQFEATVEWLSEQELLPGREYLLKLGHGTTEVTITRLKRRIQAEQGNSLPASTLKQGETGICNLSTTSDIVFDSYDRVPATSYFTIIDRVNGDLLGQVYLHFSLRRATNVHWQALEVDKTARAAMKRQLPRVIWLTGLSASGKSTIANLVEKKLIDAGKHSYLLDGDNVRHGLNRDLGFTDADRVENIRRVAEAAKLMVDAGLIVITSFISPFQSERRLARSLFDDGEFIEVFVDTPLELCEQRDPKGLYRKARQGRISNFTGLDSPYEPPQNAEVHIHTPSLSASEAAREIVEYLLGTGGKPGSA